MTYRQIRDHKFKILFMYAITNKNISECIDLYFENYPYEDENEDENTYIKNSIKTPRFSNTLKDLNNGEKDSVDISFSLSDEDNIRDIKLKLVNLVSKITDIDNILKEALKNWDINRIAKAELTILRIAVFEMYFDNTIDLEVAINEAVELAKLYGDSEADKFVNGVLATIYKMKNK